MTYYFIGIKGSGMSTLANLMYDLGNDIIGYDDADGDRQRNQFPSSLFYRVQFVGAKFVSDDNACGNAHGEECAVEDVCERYGDVAGGDDMDAAQRVALNEKRHAERPAHLIEQQWCTAYANVHEELFGDVQGTIYAFNETIFGMFHMRINDDDGHFHDA